MPYQVCDFGSALVEPDFSMVKRRGPSLPCKSLKPLTGIRDVPVANCRRRDFCSASQPRMHCTMTLAPCRSEMAISKRDRLRVEKFEKGNEGEKTHRPKVLDDLVRFGVPPVVGVLLPVVDVDVGNAADQQLEFALVEYVNQVRRDELVEAGDEGVELVLDALLDAPFGDEAFEKLVVKGHRETAGRIKLRTRCTPFYSRC